MQSSQRFLAHLEIQSLFYMFQPHLVVPTIAALAKYQGLIASPIQYAGAAQQVRYV
jgi:hypothetical protein